MPIYKCDSCNLSTTLKSNYNRHLLSKNHNRLIESSVNEPEVEPILCTQIYDCKYCGKNFKYKQSVSKHIKYTCPKNKDEDLKELVRLLNLQLQQKDRELAYHKLQNEKQQKQMDTQQKQIDKLMDKLQVNHITNNTYVQNNILSYKDTDLSHLTSKDYTNAIKKVTYCVKDMIEKIHFNPKKPENMNIYISNMKDKYLMVYEDGNWNIKQKNDEINTLYESKEMLLEDWLDNYGNEELRQKFNKYLSNKEDDETMNEIKENIKMMMYNKKKNGII